MNYTKGEWALIEDEDTFQIYVPTKSTVAKIHKRWGDDGEANANLIAAAPELYEALKYMREALLNLIRQLPTDERLADYQLDVAESADLMAEQALAKAEGGKR